jgi:hypothetical protein
MKCGSLALVAGDPRKALQSYDWLLLLSSTDPAGRPDILIKEHLSARFKHQTAGFIY